MLTKKETRELTMQIITKRGFEVTYADDKCVMFEGYGAHGSVSFVINAKEPRLKFYFSQNFTLNFEDDWKNEKVRFINANKFSKIREDLFKIYYEPPGIYECISSISRNVFERDLYIALIEYLFCIAIEGYAVLNCKNFYQKAATRTIMENTFERNIASLGSWKSPGRWTQKYA